MSLNETILEDLKQALKARDEVRLGCLRMLKSALKNKEVEFGRELSDKEIQGVISSSLKKIRESVEEFRKAGREDLAGKEEKEIEILSTYMPRQLTGEEIEERLREIISEVSAQGPKDIGKVMKTAMARLEGQAQGKEVNEIAKRLLS